MRRTASAWYARMLQPRVGDRQAFEKWYAADPDHARAFERLRSTWESAALLTRSELARNSARFHPPAYRPQAHHAFAIVLACILGFSTLFAIHSRPNGDQSLMMLATAVGEIRKVSLADGSSVTLDTDTAIQVELGPRVRQVTLTRGRARFDVARDRRPFLVRAGAARISSPDALFEVSLWGQAVRAAALERTIKLSSDWVKGGSARQILQVHAGQQALAGAGPLKARPFASDKSVWPSGMIAFDDTPLVDAVAEANRYSFAKIRLADPALERLRVSGAVRAGDSPALARSLAAAFDLKVKRTSTREYRLEPRTH